MKLNKIEVCECGHNRCEHINLKECCYADAEVNVCKCKKYKKKAGDKLI